MSKVIDPRKKKDKKNPADKTPATTEEDQTDNSIAISVKINGITYKTDIGVDLEDPSMKDIDKLCRGIKGVVKKATGKT